MQSSGDQWLPTASMRRTLVLSGGGSPVRFSGCDLGSGTAFMPKGELGEADGSAGLAAGLGVSVPELNSGLASGAPSTDISSLALPLLLLEVGA